jgi:hypothetical protein
MNLERSAEMRLPDSEDEQAFVPEQESHFGGLTFKHYRAIGSRINSLAPLTNMFVESSSDETVIDALRRVDLGTFSTNATVGPAQQDLLRTMTHHAVDLREQIRTSEVVKSMRGWRFGHFEVAPAPPVADVGIAFIAAQETFGRTRTHRAEGVDTWARRFGVSAEVSAIADLCLNVVPGADSIVITVTRDAEDGTEGLHFEILTRSDLKHVLDSEDRLHQELFDHLPQLKRDFFSIGYHFAR